MKREPHIPRWPRMIAAALAYGCAMTVSAQDYLLFDLGVLSSNEDAASYAYGINNLNFIVGETDVGSTPERQAFIWLPVAMPAWDDPFDEPGMHALGTDDSLARKISDDSVIVGQQGSRAFMWQPTAIAQEEGWGTFQQLVLPDIDGGNGDTEGWALDFESSPLRIVGSAWIEAGTFDDRVGIVWRSDEPDEAPEILVADVHTPLDVHVHTYGITPHSLIAGGHAEGYGECPAYGCPFYGLEWELDQPSEWQVASDLPALDQQVDSGAGLDVSDPRDTEPAYVVGWLRNSDYTPPQLGKQHAVIWHHPDLGDVVDLHIVDQAHQLPSSAFSAAFAIRNNALQVTTPFSGDTQTTNGRQSISTPRLSSRWSVATVTGDSWKLKTSTRMAGLSDGLGTGTERVMTDGPSFWYRAPAPAAGTSQAATLACRMATSMSATCSQCSRTGATVTHAIRVRRTRTATAASTPAISSRSWEHGMAKRGSRAMAAATFRNQSRTASTRSGTGIRRRSRRASSS